jgi:hypothetical protein
MLLDFVSKRSNAVLSHKLPKEHIGIPDSSMLIVLPPQITLGPDNLFVSVRPERLDSRLCLWSLLRQSITH